MGAYISRRKCELTYLGGSVSTGGRCEAAVTGGRCEAAVNARRRFGHVKCMKCDRSPYGKRFLLWLKGLFAIAV